MTDKEKAKELASLLVGEDQNQEPLVEILMEMAQWKQQQIMKLLRRQRNDRRLHL